MKSHSKSYFRAASCLAVMMVLGTCSVKPPAASPTPEAALPAASPEATATLEGTLNLVDKELNYLVLIDSEGSYYRFQINDADISGLEPGDAVKVSYTGDAAPDADEITANLLSIEKTA